MLGPYRGAAVGCSAARPLIIHPSIRPSVRYSLMVCPEPGLCQALGDMAQIGWMSYGKTDRPGNHEAAMNSDRCYKKRSRGWQGEFSEGLMGSPLGRQ